MKTYAVPTLLLLSLLQVCVRVSLACNPNEYWNGAKCCEKCPPGQKLVSECTAESTTQCEDCARGEFQDQWNRQKYCHPMSYCDLNAGFEETRPGTAEQDAVCRCTEGRHCSSEKCETCVHDSACGPGFGVTRRANKEVDTRCEPCPQDFFSNETSLTEPCRKWTRCETQNQVMTTPGSAFSDVTCGHKLEERNYLVKVLVPTFVILILVIVFAAWYCVRDKASRNFFANKKEKKNNPALEVFQKKPIQIAEEEDEREGLVVLWNPIEESHGEQEVGKESHLPQQEDSGC